LLLTSDPERGGIVTPEVAEEAVRLLPSMRVVRLRGAGHNIRREQFDGFIREIRQFLADANASSGREIYEKAR
jgi:pimeloyl-ACP methyl ester carboxylesterase